MRSGLLFNCKCKIIASIPQGRTLSAMDRFDLILVRLKTGLKQYELAKLLGVPATIVCDLERGRRPITPEVEKRIKEAINEVPNRKAMSLRQ